MKKIIKALRHPLYYLGLLFPSFQSFRSAYQKEYGLDSLSETALMKEIKRNIPKNKDPLVLCPPKKWVVKLNNCNYKRYFVCDFNPRRLEEISNKNIRKESIFILKHIPFSKYGIYFNLLNSVEENDRKELLRSFNKKEVVAIFYGRICGADIPPLGPEPIGSFGCKQYKTTDLYNELNNHFDIVKSYNFENNYLFVCKNKL